MSEIAEGNLSPETKYSLDVEAGKLLASVNFKGAQMGVRLDLDLDVIAILEILKAKIPGSIDDAIIAVVEAALK